MTFEELQNKTKSLNLVFFVESIFRHYTRAWVKKIFFVFSILLFVLSSGVFIFTSSKLTGLFFLFLFIFLVLEALDAIYYSYAFDDESEPYLFELGEIFFATEDNDLIGGFIRSNIGRLILVRLGIDRETLKDYLLKRTSLLSKNGFLVENSSPSLSAYLKTLYQSDKSFEHLLLSHGVTIELFLSGALWVVRSHKKAMANNRWWSRERLESIPSIGRDWAYGKAYTLTLMSSQLTFSPYEESELHGSELGQLEAALSRSQEANVILVGDEGVGKMEVVEGLARKAKRRKAREELHDKHYFVLDLEVLSARAKDKNIFEETITKLFVEAMRAGNIIFIIPDMAGLLHLGESLDCDVVELLSRFLVSSNLQIIAICDTDDFNRTIGPSRELMRHFEKIQVEEADDETILGALEDAINALEAREKVLFSYPALSEAVKSAKRYFVESPLFDAAEDLLIESAAPVRSVGRTIVTADDILTVVNEKTGIATGAVLEEEQDRLTHLEEHLHLRVVGQNEAISAISDALRRARSGVSNPDRPLGSFLFLGPTGVGKTETAKALSEIFFGPEAVMLRLDMSEYSSFDSLARLIGRYDNETPGVLSSMIREHQYGVLLLDEFEKTSGQVLDLFLQILDEGMFSDALGHKVNARNLIIVATSNAGSGYIFDVIKSGANLLSKRDEITEHIIADGTFKPELLNRFDGVILFHPLGDEHLKGVAKVMLARLSWRLKDKGMTLVVNDALINFLVSQGRDQKFGARPLNRVIQDKIEKIIADRMISGQYKVGSTIEFSATDFQNTVA